MYRHSGMPEESEGSGEGIRDVERLVKDAIDNTQFAMLVSISNDPQSGEPYVKIVDVFPDCIDRAVDVLLREYTDAGLQQMILHIDGYSQRKESVVTETQMSVWYALRHPIQALKLLQSEPGPARGFANSTELIKHCRMLLLKRLLTFALATRGIQTRDAVHNEDQ